MTRARLISSAATLLLCLVGYSQLRAATGADSPMFHFWKLNRGPGLGTISDSYNGNAILITGGGSTGRNRTLDYMTGGEADIFDADSLASAQAQRAPDHQIEKQREGDVVVQLWTFKDQDVERARTFTRRVANALHLATTQIYPGKATSVHVDIYVMPKGAPYSLARKVEWKTGRPLEIAIFLPGKTEDHSDVATHELFHVLTVLQRTSQWWDRNKQRRNAATALEEVAADLYASCGALLADGYLPRPNINPNVTYVINDIPMKPPLTGEQVKLILAGLRAIDAKPQAAPPATAIGASLGSTPILHLFERAQERIELHSSQGEKLLGMCRELLPDPMSIEPWLEGLQ